MQATDQGSFVLGYSDTTSGWFLNNNITNSLMVGFDSDISTFFVGQSNGQGTTGNVGIGELAAMGGLPNNKLEIASDGNSPTPSGLRFTNLTSVAATVPNPGAGVLSVDPNGDVIYVDAPIPTGGVGNFCGQPQNPLTADFEIPLNGFDYYFSGQGNQTNNVSVGFPCGVQPLAKLHVFQTAVNQLFTPTLGISAAGRFDNVSDALISYGAIGNSSGPAFFNVGIFGSASNGTINYAGVFDGDVLFNGDVLGSQFGWVASDEQFKTEVNNIENATEMIESLSPKTYYMDTTNSYDIAFTSELQYGMIAQEVEVVLPELVAEHTIPPKYDSLGNETSPQLTFKAMKYDALIPILTKAFQEQKATIDSLSNELNQKDALINDVNDRLTQLENCLENLLPQLCQINNSKINQNDEEIQNKLINVLDLELFDGKNLVLEQNVPNPFAEKTVINFSIPESVREAELIFYNNQGRTIKEVKIDERGPGQLNVFGSELSKGIYSYTLICDGQVISTKKMVKQ